MQLVTYTVDNMVLVDWQRHFLLKGYHKIISIRSTVTML
jgi:hypothetical protein